MVVRGLAPRPATAIRADSHHRKVFPMPTKLERVEDLFGLTDIGDDADVTFEVTETTVHSATITVSAGLLRSMLKRDAAHGRDLLTDVDSVHDVVTELLGQLDYDELTENTTTYTFGDIEVA